jgi:hypothetical protein
MRHAIDWQAFVCVRDNDWARAGYQQARDRGLSHNRALRGIAARWVRIMWRCWTDRATCHPATHLKNQPPSPRPDPPPPQQPPASRHQPRGPMPHAPIPAPRHPHQPPQIDSGSLRRLSRAAGGPASNPSCVTPVSPPARPALDVP